MAVGTETTAIPALNIVADVAINCAFPCFSETDVKVIYGIDALEATLGVDYNVALDEVNFNTFTVTPTAALIAKINALIASSTAETNSITIRRELNYLTSNDESNVHSVKFLSQELDRAAMRFQQIAEQIKRAITLSPRSIGAVTNFYIDAPVGGSLLIWNATGDTILNGPTPTDILGAQISTSADVATAQAAAAAAQGAENDAETILASVTGISATVQANADAVAAALAGATASVKASVGDTTPGNLTDKIVVSGGLLALSTLTPAGNAQRQIALTKSNLAQAQAGADDATVMTPVRVLDAIVANVQNISAAKVTSGVFATARLGTGAASSSTWLRGDGTWASSPVSLTAGAVGTYAMCYKTDAATYNFGDSIAGSLLKPTNAAIYVGSAALSGTWECRGYASGLGASTSETTLWQRIL